MIDWQKDCVKNMLHLSILGWRARNGANEYDADIHVLKENCALLVRLATQKTGGQKPYAKKDDVDIADINMILMQIGLAATSLCLGGFFGEMPELVPNAGEGIRTQSTYGQLAKALCGRENASLDECLKAANQLKSVNENRVLTLREAIQSKEPCVYIEDIDKRDIVAGIVRGCNTDQVRLSIAGRESKLLVLRNEYRKRWRCWLRIPTQAERAAVPWVVSEDA